MKKITISSFLNKMFELEEKTGEKYTLLGVGPMSDTLIEAAFRLAKRKSFPVMFIASRNQVDAEEFGKGYVNGWDQQNFKTDIEQIAKSCDFDGLYYLCRDHGGPWQRDEERNAKLPVEEAMALGKRSFAYDIKAGFDLLHIDPTKIPTTTGIVSMDAVIDMTVELIEFCEYERKKLKLPEVSYEVGTEETDGGITSAEKYEEFVSRLAEQLKQKKLPLPSFIVGNTGTLTRLTENVGKWDAKMSSALAASARKYQAGLKEHNGDYLSNFILSLHPALGITATNVAPEFGTIETRTLLMLADIEEFLYGKDSFKDEFTKAAIKSRRWVKWMTGNEKNYETDRILKDTALSKQILEIAGHYTFNDEVIKACKKDMFNNLTKAGINPQSILINTLMASLSRYVDAFNMEGLVDKIDINSC